jgi:hypothetical protein
MSATAIGINLAIAALLVFAALLTLGLCRAAGRPYPAKETHGQRVWDETANRWITLPYGVQPGPGQLTEAEVNTLDGFQIALADLVTGPQWEAGRERLFDAVRDHRTNTTEGDL